MADQKVEYDLFGNVVIKNPLLRDKFIEPPFSVLDTKWGWRQERKRQRKELWIKSEVGREWSMTYSIPTKKYDWDKMEEEYYGDKAQELNTSIFDPALCEVLYHWFVPEGWKILDPFAWWSVRGIVANFLWYKYTWIDIRPEQIESNIAQAKDLVPWNEPIRYCWDSNQVLDDMDSETNLTPIEKNWEIFIKREDYFNVCWSNWAKSRTAYYLCKKAKDDWYIWVTTAWSRKSPQISIVSSIAKELWLQFVAHCPEWELGEDLLFAKENWAQIIQYKAWYNSVIKARCREYAQENNFVEIPFGMTCNEAIEQTKSQVKNIPDWVKRIVITIWSWMNLFPKHS